MSREPAEHLPERPRRGQADVRVMVALQGYVLSAYEAPLRNFHNNWGALCCIWERAIRVRQIEFLDDSRALRKRPRSESLAMACWLGYEDDDNKPEPDVSSISSGDLSDSPDAASQEPVGPRPSIEPSVELFED